METTFHLPDLIPKPDFTDEKYLRELHSNFFRSKKSRVETLCPNHFFIQLDEKLVTIHYNLGDTIKINTFSPKELRMQKLEMKHFDSFIVHKSDDHPVIKNRQLFKQRLYFDLLSRLYVLDPRVREIYDNNEFDEIVFVINIPRKSLINDKIIEDEIKKSSKYDGDIYRLLRIIKAR